MKPFARICESRVLRRSIVVLCGPKVELKRLFFDPEGPFRDFDVSCAAHRRTWRKLEDAWHCTVDSPDCASLAFTMAYRGDAFIVMPKWDSRYFVHEAYHAAQALLRAVGTEDEELGAYVVEWLFEEICWDERPGGKGKRK